MSQRRRLRQQLRQLADIRDIMDAMKNLALVEILKVKNRLGNQQQMVQDLERIAADFLDFHPYAADRGEPVLDVWILFGSERGFCGDFNEAIIGTLDRQQQPAATQRVLLPVGGKLARRLQGRPGDMRFIGGADVVEEVGQVLNDIVNVIGELQAEFNSITVQVLFHHADTGRITCNALIPPFRSSRNQPPRHGVPPILNVPPVEFFIALVDDYLYTALHQMAYMSLLSENYRRIQHMTGALQRLDERTGELTRNYHVHRQEEITEELEVILLNASNI